MVMWKSSQCFEKSVCRVLVNPLPDDKFLDSSKLKELADDNFKFDDNGRKLSKWVENTVGKGEIACYEQFLLFPQCFQKACFPGASKVSLCWNGLKEMQESMDKCTGHHNITELLLKTVITTIQPYNHSILLFFYPF